VNIRAEIYKKSWQQIKTHPVLGIGWGNIGDVLGKDERGAGLNSSNIFLEIWLGAGILGIIAFLSVWVYILLKSVYAFFNTEDNLIKVFSLFIAISWLGITITNCFNAGILLGFLWVYMAIALIEYKKDANRN
jgi:O-antigen ligase